MTTMKAIVANKYGAPADVLEEVELPRPTATGRDLLVKISAAATNPVDFKKLNNMGDPSAECAEPVTAGYDAVGVVEEAGPEATLFKKGDEVMFAGSLIRPGTFADFTVVDERLVGRKPKNASAADAATISLVALTVWEGIVEQMGVAVPADDAARAANKDKVLLVVAGAGGVGSAAIQLGAKLLGLTVVGTASRPETVEYCKSMGAHHTINHREAYAPQLEKLGIKGIDYAMVCVDVDTCINEVGTVINPLGKVCAITLAGEMGKTNWMPLFLKRVAITFEFMFARSMFGVQLEKQGEILNTWAGHVESGLFKTTRTQTFPRTLQGVKDALAAQMSGKTIGKIALE